MAIQMRRGQLAKYDKNKMLAGEWGIAIDSDTERQKAFIAFGPGTDKEVLFLEDAGVQIKEAIESATEEAEAWAHGDKFDTREIFSGDGTTKSFTLAYEPSSISGVFVDNARTTYTRSGKTITLATAPQSSSNNVRVDYTVNVSTDNAKYYKDSAQSSAYLAEVNASAAQTASSTAVQKAGEASTAASQAQSSASTATSKASTATSAASTATTKANQAASSASQASSQATAAGNYAKVAEAWAVGTKDGTDVPSTDPQYHNNAKYYADQMGTISSDVSELKEDYALILDSAYVTDTASGSIASFTDGADNVPVKSLTVNVEPVQSGSGDPSPTNVRPISGHTSAVVTMTGKNLWKLNDSYTSTSSGQWVVSDTDFYLPSGTYTVSLLSSVSGNTQFIFKGKNNLTIANPVVNTSNKATFTINENCFKIAVTMYGSARTISEIQIEVGSTATAYESPNIQTVTIDLNGTRYGGTLDVTTGVLTVDRAYKVIQSSDVTTWRITDTIHVFIASVGGQADFNDEDITHYKSNILPSVDNRNLYFGNTKTGISRQNDRNVAFAVEGVETLADAKQWVTDNTFQVVYPLATTQIVQLLTPQEVTTILGQNNIWSDVGTVDVEYRADTKLYIEKLTAPTEDDMIADHAISANSFFMVGNTLYRATTAIASGATITVGTNATKLSLSDALNALA